MSQQSGVVGAADAPTKQKFEEVISSLTEIEKNRFLAVYLSSTVSNTDWEAALKMTGSSSKNSLNVMMNKSLRKLRDAGLVNNGTAQARVKREREDDDLIIPKVERNDSSDDSSDDLPPPPPAKKVPRLRIASVVERGSSQKKPELSAKPKLSAKPRVFDKPSI